MRCVASTCIDLVPTSMYTTFWLLCGCLLRPPLLTSPAAAHTSPSYFFHRSKPKPPREGARSSKRLRSVPAPPTVLHSEADDSNSFEEVAPRKTRRAATKKKATAPPVCIQVFSSPSFFSISSNSGTFNGDWSNYWSSQGDTADGKRY